jgi:hypothetical protein
MSTIATYQEKRFDGSRTFELSADRIFVKGKSALGTESESVLMLATLQPIVNKVRARPRGFGSGISIALAAVLLCEAGLLGVSAYLDSLLVGLFFTGVVLALATARKVEWAYFNSKAGHVILTVAFAGATEEQFRTFIDLLMQQIREVDAQAAGASAGQKTE